jgi:hypothetical protein
MGEQGRDPREVVAALLADPRMQEACRAHDLRAVLRLLRSRGVSMRRVGALTDLSPGRVHEYMTGDRKPSGFELFERISDGLRIPGRMLRLADRPWEYHPPADLSELDGRGADASVDLWTPSRTVEVVGQFTRRDLMLDLLDRRGATKTIAVLAIGPVLIEDVEKWLSREGAEDVELRTARSGRDRGLVTEEEVARLEHVAEVFRTWDDQFGGGLRRKAVVGQLTGVADILHEARDGAMSRRLFRVASHLAETAAMMSWDSGQQAKAQRYYILALRAARHSGEYAFGANILASMARQLLYLGHPDDALELVRIAQDGASGRATPTVLSMLHTRAAWAYAKMGRAQGFLRATGKAEEALANARPDDDPHWIRYFDDAELAGVTGGRLLELCRNDPRHAELAQTHIERAISLRRPKSLRSHALDQAGLAQVHLLPGAKKTGESRRDLEQAAQVGNAALDTAEKTNSDRVRVKLQELYANVVPHAKAPAIRELANRLRAYLAS